MGLSKLFTATLLAMRFIAPTIAVPAASSALEARAASTYWLPNMSGQETAVFAGDSSYKVFRNVQDYGAKGDGSTDDTAAINSAIQDGDRCMEGCDSQTAKPALVYFPPGTYMVSTPLIQTYYTQFVGDAVSPPTLKATSTFKGMAVIDSDPYEDNGANWYVNQNNFFRQVRNFVIDITNLGPSEGACIHWQVAQATSLQNIVFQMNPDKTAANSQKGIFMDNGSGGFMADLTFNGGGFGAFIGNQQFTTRNMTFNNCNTAIYLNWCWLWTMQDITINDAQIGIDMSSGGVGNIQAGSFLLLDSTISNTPVGINTLYQTDLTMTNNTLILDNVDMSSVTTAIRFAGDNSTLVAGGQKIASFAQGRSYDGSSGKSIQATQDGISKPEGLMSNGKVFTRTKPQYEALDKSSFVSAKSSGAKGDGSTDDTAAIQSLFDSATAGQVIFFDHGAYIISDTIKVPADKSIKVVGEMWPLLMADGTSFNDASNPKPVFQVGEAGDVGDVEFSDLIIETKGPAPGAVLMQWNLAGSSAGTAGLWDVHFRVGGTAGTELQSDKCAKNPNATHEANTECEGAFLLFHATQTASVYVENCWFWVADHELDLEDHSQIDIYNGRGVLLESQNPVWFWGTASEHSQMYNYQITNARNVWMSVIQTETAYMQGNPDATTPFAVNEGYFDPDFKTSCTDGSASCARTWGLRVMNSSDIYVFGGGLYSFFDNYNQDCLETESCQDNMISIESSSVHLFGISTKASVNMITLDGESMALDSDNRNTFCAAIAQFESDQGPTDGGSSSGGSGSSSSSASGSATATVKPSSTVVNTVSATNPASPTSSAGSGSGTGGGYGSGSGSGSQTSDAEAGATSTTAVPASSATTSPSEGGGSGSGSGSDSGNDSGSSPSQIASATALPVTSTFPVSPISPTASAGTGTSPDQATQVTVTVTATVTATGTCAAS